jgi:antigen flippase
MTKEVVSFPDRPAGPVDASRASYNQIVKSSSIVGGAQAINYIIALIRTKIVAVLLGPSGVGLVGLYLSTVGAVETLTGLGIKSSGVREIADANGKDQERLAQTVKTLRRACYATGVLGWVVTAALAYPLSTWVFGSPEHALALAVLGITLVLGSISGGQLALIQGVRRIGDLAKVNVLGVAVGTVIALPLYWVLGQRGILPALIVSAVANLACSWWFSRKIEICNVSQTFGETLRGMRGLLGLGLAFMWSALLTAVVGLIIRALIQRDLGLDASGLYQAAWAISGMFAGFILSAMGADFYPRLTEARGDIARMSQLINEQTEVGVLLALPGLVATMVFAPWLMTLLYSSEFEQGAALLPWFLLGVFGRVVSWPMGFVMPAVGAGGWFAFAETLNVVVHLGLTYLLLASLGLVGSAVAFAALYLFVTIVVVAIAFHLIRFRWSQSVLRMLGLAGLLVGLAFLIESMAGGVVEVLLGAAITLVTCVYTARGLAFRLGTENRIVGMLLRLPGGRQICGV